MRWPLLFLSVQRLFESFADQLLPNRVHRVHVHIQSCRRLLVGPARPMLSFVHFQQDLSSHPLFRRYSFLTPHDSAQDRSLIFTQPHDVTLPSHSSLPCVVRPVIASSQDTGTSLIFD